MLTFLLIALASAAPPEILVETALQDSPSLAALRARVRTLDHRADVAGVWPSPTLGLEVSNLPMSLDPAAHPMTGLQLRVQQPLPPRGWSAIQHEIGVLATEHAAQALAEAELQLCAGIHRTWWQLVRSHLLEATTVEHLDRTRELLAAARARYEVGGLGQHAILHLEVLRDRLSDELGDHQREQRELRAALTAAIGGPLPEDLPVPTAVEPLPPPASPAPADTDSRPALSALQTRQREAAMQATRTRVSARISSGVYAGYRLRLASDTADGADLVSVGATMSLPSQRRADREQAAWLSEAQAAAAEQEALTLQIVADVERSLARWIRAHDKATRYRTDVIPGAEATLQTTLAEFSLGRADLSVLYEAEVALLELERARIRAAVETHLQRAGMLSVLGVDPVIDGVVSGVDAAPSPESPSPTPATPARPR